MRRQTPCGSALDLVTIDVVATSANGAPVPNLRAEDFEIFEDGQPQAVQTFQFVDLSSTSAIRPLPPGIASNEVEPGGLFVVVLDELGLQADDVSQARRVSERFFKETLLPNDYVAIIRSGSDSGFFLTSDRALALNTIPQITVLWFSRGGDPPPGYFDAVEMGRLTGRDDEVLSKLIDTARAANVAIYTVDPRGLQSPAADVSRDPEPFDTGTVRDLAGATGGRALLGNDSNAALARVAAENRAYYLIGYAPSAAAGKNRARKLTVRTRAPGVSLLHRRVYLPSTGTQTTALSLIESALPIADLPIALAPAAVAGEGNRRGILVPFEIGEGLVARGEDGFLLDASCRTEFVLK